MKALLMVGLLALSGCADESQRYRHEYYGFALTVPADMGWQEDYLGSAVMFQPRPNSALASELRYVSVDINDAREAGGGLADYAQFRLSRLQRFARDSEIHHREARQLAGYEALRLSVSAQYGPQKNQLLLYYVVAGDRGYAFTAALRPNASAEAVSRMDELFSSLILAPR